MYRVFLPLDRLPSLVVEPYLPVEEKKSLNGKSESNRKAERQLKDGMGKKVFSSPKQTSLNLNRVERILEKETCRSPSKGVDVA